MFTLGAITLFGMLGLVVDIGWAYYHKEAAQAAAEAAANAAVKAAYSQSGGSISCGSNSVVCQTETACPSSISGNGSNNIQKGCLYAMANGYTSTGKQKVTLETGTGSISGVTVSYYAIAKVSERLPQLFSAVTGNYNANLTARSIVGYVPATAGGCIYVLNPTAVSMTMNGNTFLDTGCGVYVDSNNAAAITMVGNSSITATGGSKVNVVGNVSIGSNSSITPTAVTGAPTFTDPLAGLDAPSDGTCQTPPSPSNNDNVTISAGTYCGDLNVTGHAKLTLNPGLYIIKGNTSTGGLSVGGQATINGSGVTIYIETGTISFAGGASSNLTAPTSGNWQGILIFQARGDTTGASLAGGASQLTSGVIYIPSAGLTFNGGSSNNSQAATIVSNTFTVTGNSYIQSSATSPYLSTETGVVVIE